MACGHCSRVTASWRRSPRTAAAGHRHHQGVGRVWVVDPLDGTVNYAHGLPFFCVSIGMVIDGRAAVGVVFDPTRGDLYEAVVGGGARRNGEPVAPLPRATWPSAWPRSSCRKFGWRARARAVTRATQVNRGPGQLGPGAGARGRRPLRRLRPGRRPVGLGRGRGRPRRGRGRRHRDRPGRRPVAGHGAPDRQGRRGRRRAAPHAELLRLLAA